MARIVVVGGGLIGLATAVMVAKRGHDVTVLERDPEPLPNTPREAWDWWKRSGVMQFRQPHFLLPQGRRVLDAELPEVVRALLDAGAAPRTVNARRPVLEHAVATVADKWAETRRGARAVGLLTSGSRHVTGVRLHTREELLADLVIDATGRSSPLPVWLTAAGAGEIAERAEHSSVTSYSRYFRARPGEEPPPILTGTCTPFDCYSILAIPSDARTWAVTVCVDSRDRALMGLRDQGNWTRLVSACPLHAHLITGGEPITGVLAASGVVDRIRDLVSHGVPAATGVLPVGDSWACTNPALGRGVTFGLLHAMIIAEAVAEHLKHPLALSLAYDRLTRERLVPWYRDTVDLDNQRAAQITAVIEGRPPGRAGDSATAASGRKPWAAPGPSRAEVLTMLS